jgi:co-chaperonin GroES (HSP10)
MTLSGGDVLARGNVSAQFSAGNREMTDFEHDLAVRPEVVSEKYGLSEAEITNYQEARENGENIPDLRPVGEESDSLTSGVTVIDRRSSFNDPKPVKEVEKKFEDKDYSAPQTILDRVLVKRIPEDPEFERLEDGSLRNKRTGFVIPAAYRQHNNVGIVLVTGKFVALGGLRIEMEEVVRPGDRVTFGDYNSEVYKLSPEKTQKLCDAVEMNYEADDEGLRVIRVQDIRTVERPKADYWDRPENQKTKPMGFFKTVYTALRTAWLLMGVTR